MTKKKRLGTKAQIRVEKEKERWIATTILLAVILLIVILSTYFTYTFLNQSQNQIVNSATPQLKAAIVDHLSLTYPNQTFIQTVTSTLKQAGYSVDYYSGEKVTVELYRNLPAHGYKIVILRVHSTASCLSQGEFVRVPVFLFTSELYSTSRYVSEQLADQVFRAAFDTPNSKDYFAVGPNFITYGMKGNFQNATIIMMGCEGLTTTQTAEAFVDKGAKAYISWSGSVSASHTDTATTNLLQHLISEKQTIKQAVENTMNEVGPDPTYNSQLTYYPPEA